MNNFKRSKLALGIALALSAIAFNPSLAMADDSNKPDLAVVAPSITYDVDYMDEGVRVIIPKLLTEIKLNENVRLEYMLKSLSGKNNTSILTAMDFDDSVAAQYKSLGFDIEHTNVFRRGATEVNQFLSFSGNEAGLDDLNKNFGKADFFDSVRTAVGNTVGVVAGVVVGGAIGGNAVAVQAGVGSLSRNSTGNVNIKNAKVAVFDGYQNIPAKADDNIVIYGVTTKGGKNSGKVIFITDKTEVDEAVVIRGVIKAQNISK